MRSIYCVIHCGKMLVLTAKTIAATAVMTRSVSEALVTTATMIAVAIVTVYQQHCL